MRKSIALILALFMLITLFAGCRKTEVPADNSEPSEEPAASEPVSSEPVSSEPDPEDGSTSLLPYDGDLVEWWGYGADLSVTESEDSYVYKLWKSKTGNIAFNWELCGLADDYDTKLALYLNAGEVPDLIWARAELHSTYGDTGLFTDLRDYYDYMPNWVAMIAKNPTYETALQRPDGSVYALVQGAWDGAAEGWKVNMTVLNELGYTEAPTTLAETYDVMRAAASAGKIGYVSFWGLDYYVTAVGLSTECLGTGFVKADPFSATKGDWSWGLLDQSTKDRTEWVNKAYTEGLLHPDIATMSAEDAFISYAQGNWAYSFNYTLADNLFGSGVPFSINDPLPYDVKGIMTPMLDANATPMLSHIINSDSPGWNYVVGITAENKELLCSVIDLTAEEEMSVANCWGEEGVSWEWTADGSSRKWIDSFVNDPDLAANKLALGIWNTTFLRFLCKNDATDSMASLHPADKEWKTLYAEALESGSAVGNIAGRTPLLTDAESEEYATIMTAVNTFVSENLTLFHLGQRDISEWDAFIEEAKAMGDVDRALEIYNNATPGVARATPAQRTFSRP